jgi:hypothetical protein
VGGAALADGDEQAAAKIMVKLHCPNCGLTAKIFDQEWERDRPMAKWGEIK